MKLKIFLALALSCASLASGAQSLSTGTKWRWDMAKGYRHAYAAPEDETVAEAAAKAYTAAHKKTVADFRLWELYDAIKTAKNPDAARKAYDYAAAKASKSVAKALAGK